MKPLDFGIIFKHFNLLKVGMVVFCKDSDSGFEAQYTAICKKCVKSADVGIIF